MFCAFNVGRHVYKFSWGINFVSNINPFVLSVPRSTSLNQSVLTSGTSLMSTPSLLTTSSKLPSNQQLFDPNSLHNQSLHNQSNLQDLSLFLHQQNILSAPSGIIKREPEDLSHRRASPGMTDLKKSKIVLVGGHQQQDSLVIDVVNNNNIKDEFSPHNRNGGEFYNFLLILLFLFTSCHLSLGLSLIISFSFFVCSFLLISLREVCVKIILILMKHTYVHKSTEVFTYL